MSPANFDVNAIGAYLREQGEQARNSIRQLARAAGVSNPNLAQQIAKGLRISADALYIQAGILEEKEGDSSVTEAILADREITDRQKQMLVEIYESFRKEVRAEAAAEEAQAARVVAAAEEAEEADGAVEDAVQESGHDPVVDVVAAAEAEPWTEPPPPHVTG
jgi:transcriptional regulator with XRE-family HTH domain